MQPSIHHFIHLFIELVVYFYPLVNFFLPLYFPVRHKIVKRISICMSTVWCSKTGRNFVGIFSNARHGFRMNRIWLIQWGMYIYVCVCVSAYSRKPHRIRMGIMPDETAPTINSLNAKLICSHFFVWGLFFLCPFILSRIFSLIYTINSYICARAIEMRCCHSFHPIKGSL